MTFSTCKLACALLATLALSACVTLPNSSSQDNQAELERKSVRLTQTQRGAMISSDERILFDSNKSEIKPEGQVFLDRVAAILKEKTKANVIIEGHTDNSGNTETNLQLSKDRALAVKQAFLTRGLQDARIQTQGFGETRPVADNVAVEGRQSNRRTEIIVLGESIDKLGGASLADQLSEGLGRFLKNATAATGDLINKVKSSIKK